MPLFAIDGTVIAIICWAVVFVIAIIVEITTTELVSIWFAGGALVSLILSIFDIHWAIQLTVFLAVSIILLLLTRPLLKKKLNSKKVATNVDSLIGQQILLIKDVSKDHPGEGKIRDITWTVVTLDNETYKANQYVVITKILGNKLLVTHKEEENV